MTEVIVFFIVAVIAILSAAMMLISSNAIHSALFLVLNFACVAFFFLTLNAPFIFLVQIAVYAGAIMVLFLFVIMLLGAERTTTPTQHPTNWLPRAALVLALIFVITVGVAIGSGEIDLTQPLPEMPRVRVIHAADAPPVDVYFNNELEFPNLAARSVSDFTELEPGEYGITAFPAGADPATSSPAILGSVTLEAGDLVTTVASGADGEFLITALPKPAGPLPDQRELRLFFFNALPDSGSLDLVLPRADFAGGDLTLFSSVAYAQPVDYIVREQAEDIDLAVRTTQQTEAVTNEAGETTTQVVGGGDELYVYKALDLPRNSNLILLLAPQTLTTGQVRNVPMEIDTPTDAQYGSPQDVGQMLFTRYLLPFEVLGILLLAALVGAVALTREELVTERVRRKVVRHPLVGPQAAMTAADLEALHAAQQPPSSAPGD